MSKQIYTLTFDSGLGLTTWKKTAEELLAPNGTEPLIAWMLRMADERGSVLQFSTGKPVQGFPIEKVALNPEFRASLDAAEAELKAKDRAEKAKVWQAGYQAAIQDYSSSIPQSNPYEDD